MRAIRSKGTALEMRVRRLVHGMGYRYRVSPAHVIGRPDLVFLKHKKAIFVNGCFWHQHDDPSCSVSRLPKSRQEYWSPKLARNCERDKFNLRHLEEMDWSVLVLWECEIRHGADLKGRIERFLSPDEGGRS